MRLERLLEVLGVEYAELWPDSRRARLNQKAARLEAALRRRYDALILRQRQIERLRERIRRAEQQSVALAARMQQFYQCGAADRACAHAADVDRLHAALEMDEEKLRRHECLYQHGLAAVEHLKRRLAAVRETCSRLTPRARTSYFVPSKTSI